MKYEIKGRDLPYVEITLNKGEKVVSESGYMCWMDDGFTLDTSTNGGFMKGLGRLFTGNKFFQNNYTAEKDNLKICFASSLPGAILAVPISADQSLIVQKKAFLASHGNIESSVYLNKKFGAGFFGGEGFVLQKITGEGTAFIEIDGAVAEYDLVENQKLIVSSTHLVSMSETCQMDIQAVKGLKNKLLGGEGWFNTVITGPGKVYVQSMPVFKLANAIDDYIEFPTSTSTSSNND